MPNHITNILDVTGPKNEVKEFKNRVFSITDITDRVYNFNFNATVPMPDELNIESSSREKMEPIYKANMEKFGYKDWYSWSINTWGTKWNSYSVEKYRVIKGGYRFRFDTAWSPPDKWLIKTAELFPSLEFKDWWIDEGGGAGIITLHGETWEDERIPDEDWLIKFNPEYRKEYKFITRGKYDSVIEEYTKNNESSRLSRHLLDRIKDKDLPLFLEFEWYGEMEENFYNRLKESSIQKEVACE